MYTLYWSPASANMTPHAMLEDIGVPYELIKVDTSKGEQRSPDYLKVNPHGRVPTLVYDGDKILYETTAIALFLAERHPEAGFAPKHDSPDRPPFLQWMAYLTNTLQIALGHWWRPAMSSMAPTAKPSSRQRRSSGPPACSVSSTSTSPNPGPISAARLSTSATTTRRCWRSGPSSWQYPPTPTRTSTS